LDWSQLRQNSLPIVANLVPDVTANITSTAVRRPSCRDRRQVRKASSEGHSRYYSLVIVAVGAHPSASSRQDDMGRLLGRDVLGHLVSKSGQVDASKQRFAVAQQNG
jgi:hypothetical protein